MAIAGEGDDVNTVWYKVDGPGTEYIRGWGLGAR